MTPELRITIDNNGEAHFSGPIAPHDWRLRHVEKGTGRVDLRAHTWRCDTCGLVYIGQPHKRPHGPCPPPRGL